MQNIPIHFMKPEIFLKHKNVEMDFLLCFESVCFNVT